MFFWTFWYIICIFMILFELDMIFPRYSNFLEFETNRKYRFTPNLLLATSTDWWTSVQVRCHLGRDRVKIVDWSKMTSSLRWTHRWFANSMISHELANETSQKRFSGSRWFMWWWRRSDLVTGACSGELYCDGRTVVYGDGELQRLLQLDKMLRRFGFSPGCFQDGRRGESWSEVTSTSPIPASLLQKGTAKIRRLRTN
jgi:hypothetical protein